MSFASAYHAEDQDSYDEFLESKGVVPTPLLPAEIAAPEEKLSGKSSGASDKGKEEANTATSDVNTPKAVPKPVAENAKSAPIDLKSPQCPFCRTNIIATAQGCNCGAFAIVTDNGKKKKKKKGAKKAA